VDGLDGKFFIFSGNAAYYKSRINESILRLNDNQYWNGTLIALRIPRNIKEEIKNYLQSIIIVITFVLIH